MALNLELIACALASQRSRSGLPYGFGSSPQLMRPPWLARARGRPSPRSSSARRPWCRATARRAEDLLQSGDALVEVGAQQPGVQHEDGCRLLVDKPVPGGTRHEGGDGRGELVAAESGRLCWELLTKDPDHPRSKV